MLQRGPEFHAISHCTIQVFCQSVAFMYQPLIWHLNYDFKVHVRTWPRSWNWWMSKLLVLSRMWYGFYNSMKNYSGGQEKAKKSQGTKAQFLVPVLFDYGQILMETPTISLDFWQFLSYNLTVLPCTWHYYTIDVEDVASYHNSHSDSIHANMNKSQWMLITGGVCRPLDFIISRRKLLSGLPLIVWNNGTRFMQKAKQWLT